jgi:hypothetical protein
VLDERSHAQSDESRRTCRGPGRRVCDVLGRWVVPDSGSVVAAWAGSIPVLEPMPAMTTVATPAPVPRNRSRRVMRGQTRTPSRSAACPHQGGRRRTCRSCRSIGPSSSSGPGSTCGSRPLGPSAEGAHPHPDHRTQRPSTAVARRARAHELRVGPRPPR